MSTYISWRPYEETPDSTVTGDIRVSEPVGCPHLDIERELFVYLPPSASDSDRSFPVVYMHDGQNLFDDARSFDGEWRVDETMERLAAEGTEAIVVGIPNAGEMRPVEYSPMFDEAAASDPEATNPYEGIEPLGEAYAQWLVDGVMATVDRNFPTSDRRADTGVVGSSMGGLISAYTFFAHPKTFGFFGAMSPAVGGPWRGVLDFVENVGHVEGRAYVDVGGDEYPDHPERSTEFYEAAHDLADCLEGLGYGEDLRFVVDEDAVHHEDEWAARFPEAIRFLLDTA